MSEDKLFLKIAESPDIIGYLIHTSRLSLTLRVGQPPGFDMLPEPRVALRMEGDASTPDAAFELSALAFSQIINHCGIPWTYAERMLTSAKQLLIANANCWLRGEPTERLLCVQGANLVAFLPPKYCGALGDRLRRLDQPATVRKRPSIYGQP